MKLHAAAAARNREPIEAVLREELPPQGTVLEIASGTGEHAAHFAAAFPTLDWQPSDIGAEAIASITAWRTEALASGAGVNLRSPMMLDISADATPAIPGLSALIAINLVHIAPLAASEGLFRTAGRLLPAGAPLILYGPYIEDGLPIAASNLAFESSLRMRNPQWGLRRIAWLDALASENRMRRTRRVGMPANNLMLIYRRSG